jgi:hypothetical protein
MAAIRSIEHQADGVTERTVIGVLTLTDILDALHRFYAGDEPPRTRLVLWDLSHASLDTLSSDDARRLAEAMSGYAAARQGGKTAVVVRSELAFGLSRMYEHWREVQQIDLSFMVFRERGKAWAWLTGHPQDPPT